MLGALPTRQLASLSQASGSRLNVVFVNGVPVLIRRVHRTVEARLTTERFANGRWERPVLATRVQQRCPMNPNRDSVTSGYPARLHRACLPSLLPEMTTERALAAWVGEAAQSAGDEVQKAVVVKAFGEAVARAMPVTGKFDHNADAEELIVANRPGTSRPYRAAIRLTQDSTPSFGKGRGASGSVRSTGLRRLAAARRRHSTPDLGIGEAREVETAGRTGARVVPRARPRRPAPPAARSRGSAAAGGTAFAAEVCPPGRS